MVLQVKWLNLTTHHSVFCLNLILIKVLLINLKTKSIWALFASWASKNNLSTNTNIAEKSAFTLLNTHCKETEVMLCLFLIKLKKKYGKCCRENYNPLSLTRESIHYSCWIWHQSSQIPDINNNMFRFHDTLFIIHCFTFFHYNIFSLTFF